MSFDADDIDLVLTGCRPFGVVGLLACVEGILTDADLYDPFGAWRQHRARQRLFRSWLHTAPADPPSAPATAP